MSSSAFDRAAAEEVATELNVSAGMVEKEWHAVRVAALAVSPALGGPRLLLAFGGGTSLSAAHDLIERFSEDVDIRIGVRHGPGLALRDVQDFCGRLTHALVPLGYELDAGASEDFPDHVSSRRAYRYAARFEAVEPVRPFVKVDVSAAACARPTVERPLGSRLDRALGISAGRAICVCPLETAADKLSALAWRVHDGRALREPHTMRHLHDVHALAAVVSGAPGRFADMVLANLSRDVSRIQGGRGARKPIPRDLLGRLPLALGNSAEYRRNYDRFARAFAFGAKPDFGVALGSLQSMVARVCR